MVGAPVQASPAWPLPLCHLVPPQPLHVALERVGGWSSGGGGANMAVWRLELMVELYWFERRS